MSKSQTNVTPAIFRDFVTQVRDFVAKAAQNRTPLQLYSETELRDTPCHTGDFCRRDTTRAKKSHM